MNALTAIVADPLNVADAWFHGAIAAERDALSAFLQRSRPSVAEPVALIARQTQPIVLIGVGKSGHVAAKLAATFSSLGTAALYVNAAEAAHGDLGNVASGSVVVLISNSGSTEEILRILPALKARRCMIVGIIGRRLSPLARSVDHLIAAEETQEADHLGMAPTCSTTLHLAIGDALAVSVSRMRGFTRTDFLHHHPAGLLGRQMMSVASLMHCGDDLPKVAPTTSLLDLLAVMSSKRLGAAGVVDGDNRLLGLVVDGDVRRHIQAGGDLQRATAAAIMHTSPQVVAPDATVGDVMSMRAAGAWLVLPVIDASGRLCGMLHSNDLMRG